MSAEIETMFYVREKPWHGMGTRVEKALDSIGAIKQAGLDWEVQKLPIYDGQGREIPGYKASTRSADRKVLGIVGNRYSIVQNWQAFDFTDSLVGAGLTYETAGSLFGGKKIWLLGKMPERTIAGDKTEPYICFMNTHDGSGSVKCCMTPIRVVCNNTLNLALTRAKRSWSTVHRGNVQDRLEDAKRSLELADKYLDELDKTADRLKNERMTSDQLLKAVQGLFPVKDDATPMMKQNIQKQVDEFYVCVLRPDLKDFIDTKWGFVNAVADYVDHASPVRMTKNFNENRFDKVVGGHPMLDKALSLVTA